MAEIWPRLKKKFGGDARRRKKSSEGKKTNSCASSGLEKIAALLHGVQAKKTSSLVQRTGASVCAARSLSQSAQEWTASTLTRTVCRRSESQEGSKSPEIVLFHCAVRPSEAQTRSSEYTECFAFAEAGFEARVSNSGSIEEEKPCPKSENVCEFESLSVGKLHRDFGNLSEEKQSPGNNSTKEQASFSATLCVALPVKTSRCMMKTRRSGWRQTSSSAFVVLVALGAFISSRFGKVGNPLAAVLTFNTVVGIWRKGKLYARFMLSSVALYFLSPLRSYLTYYCPRRLSLLPRKLKVITDAQSTDEASRKLKIEIPHEGRSSSLEISVPPLELAPSAAIKQGAPLLVTIPEISILAEAPATSSIESVPATVIYKKSGASRRLAKKLASRFKKLKIFGSSSSQSSVSLLSVSESSLASPPSDTRSSEPDRPISPSSPDKHGRKCPFSLLHKPKSDISSEVAEVAEAMVHTSDKVPSGNKKSRLRRKLSTEILEQPNDTGEIVAFTIDTTSTSRSAAAEPEATDRASRNVSWPGVGLLVTLLFLLVGRLPAIMATSLFLLVVSNAHHDRAHPRGRGSEIQALKAARKLHRSPPPRRS